MTDGHAGTAGSQPQGLTQLYLIAWLVLVAITAIEVSLILVFRVPPAVRATALIILAIMKATLIGAYYMGLRFERLAVVYVAVIPLLLLILMLIAVVPDVALLLGHH
jgi:cytochrome c oxidase subunit IV